MDILISSFSKYNDVLHSCLIEYDKLNPDLSFRVISDAKIDFVPKNISLQFTYLDNDQGWLQSVLHLLEDYDETDHVILCMDDLMPLSFVGDEVLSAFVSFSKNKNIDSLKLYEPPNERIFSSINSGFSRIERCDQDRYPISTMLSIFKVSFLRTLLTQSSDAWDFERGASSRISSRSQCYTSPFNIFDFSNLVVKGRVVASRLNSDMPVRYVLKNMSRSALMRYYVTIIFSTYKSFSLKKFFRFMVH